HGGDLVLAAAARTADPAAVCELADAVAEVGAQDRNEVQPAPDALRPLDDTAGEALHLVPERGGVQVRLSLCNAVDLPEGLRCAQQSGRQLVDGLGVVLLGFDDGVRLGELG